MTMHPPELWWSATLAAECDDPMMGLLHADGPPSLDGWRYIGARDDEWRLLHRDEWPTDAVPLVLAGALVECPRCRLQRPIAGGVMAYHEAWIGQACPGVGMAPGADEKGCGPSYRRGFADGRMAERAGPSSPNLRDEVVAILPAVEHLVKTGWVLGTFGRPGHTGADLGEIVKLVIESLDALRAGRPTTTASDGDQPPFAPELTDAPIVTGESGAPAPLVVDQPVHESTLPAELEGDDQS